MESDRTLPVNHACPYTTHAHIVIPGSQNESHIGTGADTNTTSLYLGKLASVWQCATTANIRRIGIKEKMEVGSKLFVQTVADAPYQL